MIFQPPPHQTAPPWAAAPPPLPSHLLPPTPGPTDPQPTYLGLGNSGLFSARHSWPGRAQSCAGLTPAICLSSQASPQEGENAPFPLQKRCECGKEGRVGRRGWGGREKARGSSPRNLSSQHPALPVSLPELPVGIPEDRCGHASFHSGCWRCGPPCPTLRWQILETAPCRHMEASFVLFIIHFNCENTTYMPKHM